LPNVGPYIYDVSISGFTRSSIYIYDISSLRVKHYTSVAVTFGVDFALNVSAETATVQLAWFGILLSCLYELVMARLTVE